MKNTAEDNKRIAEFMGMQYYSKSQDGSWYRLTEGSQNLIHDSAFDYHESWKSLMSVVERIIDYKYDDTVDGTAYLRTFGMKDDDGRYLVRFNRSPLHSAETLLTATYVACVDFINWDKSMKIEKTTEAANKSANAAEMIRIIGLDVEGYDDATIAFKLDGLNCDIEVDEVFEGMNEQDVRNICTMYSCCGDVLNKDNMMCPTCKEHC